MNNKLFIKAEDLNFFIIMKQHVIPIQRKSCELSVGEKEEIKAFKKMLNDESVLEIHSKDIPECLKEIYHDILYLPVLKSEMQKCKEDKEAYKHIFGWGKDFKIKVEIKEME